MGHIQGVPEVLQHHIFTFSVFARNAMILFGSLALLVERTRQSPYNTRTFVAAGHLYFRLERPITNIRPVADTEVADLVERPKIVSFRVTGLMLGNAVLGAVSVKPDVTQAIAFR